MAKPESEPAAAPAPAGLTPQMQAAFAALRRQFCAGLAGRWQRIEQAPSATERIQALHQLAGAAGSYGLPDLSAAAKAAELAAQNGPASALPAALAALHSQIRQTQQALDTI